MSIFMQERRTTNMVPHLPGKHGENDCLKEKLIKWLKEAEKGFKINLIHDEYKKDFRYEYEAKKEFLYWFSIPQNEKLELAFM